MPLVMVCALMSALVLPVFTRSAATLLAGQWPEAGQALAVASNSVLGVIAVGLVWHFNLGRSISRRRIFVLGAVLAAIAGFSPPLLEDDFYRYLWDAYQWHTQASPYTYSPSDFFGDEQLAPRWQEILTGINNPHLKTLYGPVLQYLFYLAYWLAPGELWAWQLVLWLIYLGGLLLILKTCADKNGPLCYALHPLILQEAIASAHPDLLVGLLLLVALLCWQKRMPVVLGAVLGVAIATKVSALVVAPLFCCVPPSQWACRVNAEQSSRHSILSWLCLTSMAVMLMLVLFYGPVVWHTARSGASASELDSLLVFGHQWRFNPLSYRVLELFLPAALARLLCALVLLFGCLGLITLMLALAHRYRRLPVVFLLLLLLFLSPVVNPWYWLWLLPLACYLARPWVVLVAVFAPVSYINSTVLAQINSQYLASTELPFLVPWWVTLLQLMAFAWLLLSEWRWFASGSSDN
ncbi:hypothetical protein [Halioxenophilus aromaticivorans]|uniref:DUF2029 domain-containing protein n=1 Tax=Halioxenophilus aromaticivorans TaxID=1306992 RepID=A0AAV3U8S0_9ALTE